MLLAESATGKYLVEGSITSVGDLQLLQEELSKAAPEMGGYVPLDAARLRSPEAVWTYGVWLYVVVRALRPKVVLETGVQNGCSTEMILWAIHRNGRGRLFSLDSGPTSSDGSHHTAWHQTTDGIPGKDILEQLKMNWDLTVGLSRDRLAEVCRRASNVDIFWHDSDHSRDNVEHEFRTVKCFVPVDGLLCLHDYHGQETTLEEPGYTLLVPQEEPCLRVWRKVGEVSL